MTQDEIAKMSELFKQFAELVSQQRTWQGLPPDELLRLHAKTADADQVIEQRHAMISNLHALNQELANELKRLVADAESNIRSEYEGTKELSRRLKSLAPARAAIAKATGDAA
jgi:DNA repair exonuclease SbcCD ATPase subunit